MSSHEDVLRRALRAAAESVETSDNGLERIRERIATPPFLSFASLAAWYSQVSLRAASSSQPLLGVLLRALRPVIDALRPVAELLAPVVDRFRPASGNGSRLGWLRPVAAMGTAVFVVAAGAFAVMTLPQVISQDSQVSPGGGFTQGHGGGHGGGQGAVAGTSPLPSGGQTAAGFGYAPSPSAAASCLAVKKHGKPSSTSAPSSSASTSPSSSPSSSPTPTPVVTPTPTPTPTPDPSASPSSSVTPDPGSTSTASPSSSASTSPAGGGDTAAPGEAAANAQGPKMVPAAVISPSPCPSDGSTKKVDSPEALGSQLSYGIGAASPAERARTFS